MSAKQYFNTSGGQEWFIAHNNVDVFHTGMLEPGQQVETGQPNIELFDTLEAFQSRCSALGIPEQVAP